MFGKIIWQYLFVILHPSYWTSNHDTDPVFDKKILKLLEQGTPLTIVDDYYVKIGPYTLWSHNHPYASYTLRSHSTKSPSRYTRHLLKKEQIKALSLID